MQLAEVWVVADVAHLHDGVVYADSTQTSLFNAPAHQSQKRFLVRRDWDPHDLFYLQEHRIHVQAREVSSLI